MNFDEIEEVINWLGSGAIVSLDVIDNATLMLALAEMAQKVKPIMMKAEAKKPGGTFLFKL